MAAESEHGEELEAWQDLLPTNPLFKTLQLACARKFGKRNLLCEIRGDLFVWSSDSTALLTTNLKRIVAFPAKDLVYQVPFPLSSYTVLI